MRYIFLILALMGTYMLCYWGGLSGLSTGLVMAGTGMLGIRSITK